eukprot:Gb_02855 [translate_table: standard]
MLRCAMAAEWPYYYKGTRSGTVPPLTKCANAMTTARMLMPMICWQGPMHTCSLARGLCAARSGVLWSCRALMRRDRRPLSTVGRVLPPYLWPADVPARDQQIEGTMNIS